jgi:hypothetical protein
VYSDTIRVLAGVLGRFGLSGYPSAAIAGAPFPSPANDVQVMVYDIYGNVKTNYTDSVFFAATDPQASLPNPYRFVSGDAGVHTFAGGGFIFRTAGARRLIISRGSLADSSSDINISAAGINSYSLSAPDSVVAGTAFQATVNNAIDAFNNSASGLVVIADSVGAGGSPNGTPPIFSNIVVSNGSGTSAQILTRTGSVRLKGTALGTIIRGTNLFNVAPGNLGELAITVASPQISGNPITGASTIIAKDNFGNTKINFNAAGDSVIISSSPTGPFENNILKRANDFVGGVANLAALNIIYRGQGGQIRFGAASQTGVFGQSNAVDVISLRATNLTLDTRQVARQDTAVGQLRFINLGGVPISIAAISIFDFDGMQFNPWYTPTLPAEIPGGADTSFVFRFVVPAGISLGQHPLSMKITGNYSGFLTSDSLISFTDTLTVLSASQLQYIANSFSPQTVSTGADYPFSIVFRNSGDARISINDTSYITFSDGVTAVRSNLAEASYIDPGVQARLNFDSVLISSTFNAGFYNVAFHYFGNELNGEVAGQMAISDSIRVQTAAEIGYIGGSLIPDTLLSGSPAKFRARFGNAGQAALVISQGLTRIFFTDGNNQYLAVIDTASFVRIDTILSGDTTLTFNAITIPAAFIPGGYNPSVHIDGFQNQKHYVNDLATDTIRILTPGQVRLDSLYILCYNTPKVNTSQMFRIHGFVSNLGVEAVDSIRFRLTSDGHSIFDGNLMVASLAGLSGIGFDYGIRADSLANPSEIFHCNISAATNRISGLPASIAPPLDNSAAAVIEQPASFVIDTLYTTNDSLSTGQRFDIYARAAHSGSNSYSGSNQVILDFSGDAGFVFSDSATRNFISGQMLDWRVTAPADTRPSRVINLRFNGYFLDLNDSTSALGDDSIKSIAVVVTNRASISHFALITAPVGAKDMILSTSQPFVLTDTLHLLGNAGQGYARITMPTGFASLDPIVQVQMGQGINWRLIAPADSSTDSIRIDCWTFDRNTGDSIYSQPIWLPLQIVQKAILSVGADIIAPPSAMDRIIEPGGYFVIRASAVNLGEAATGEGQLQISFADNRFTTNESVIRDFYPGQSIEWTVNAPDVQILEGTQLAVTISAIPVDSNTDLPSFVIRDSTGFVVILKNELPHLVLRNPSSLRGAAVKGQPLDIYSFILQNSVELANNQIAFLSFAYWLGSGDSRIAPNQAISGSTLNINGISYYGILTDSNVVFEFNPNIIIEPDSLLNIRLGLTLNSQPAIDRLNINFGSSDLKARVIFGGVLEQFVQVVLPDGQDFAIESIPLAIVESAFNSSISLNHNPYLAGDGNLEIGYNLSGDAELEFTIYNVEGAKIWQLHLNAASGGHYGDEALFWDGRTSSGERAISGVYYLFVSNLTSGEKTKLKIAVIW